jgi:hypothetical protein
VHVKPVDFSFSQSWPIWLSTLETFLHAPTLAWNSLLLAPMTRGEFNNNLLTQSSQWPTSGATHMGSVLIEI